MIHFIHGTLSDVAEGLVVVEAVGVGYGIHVPASVIGALPPIGEDIKIYTYFSLTQNGVDLYGFLSPEDRAMFTMLLTVSGIGPKGALGILSTIAPNQFRLAVLSGDSKTISKSPGIGPKTAQKLIIELKDKMKIEDVFEDDIPADLNGSDYDQDAGKEAVMALVSLGYSESEAFAALKKITLTPDMDSETILKLALKKMLTF